MARTFTVGGAISGYSETGSDRCTMAPAIVRMMDRTAAKIGRSMKKCERRMALLCRSGALRRFDLSGFGSDRRAGPHERVGKPANHDVVVLLQPALDDAQAQREPAQRHRLRNDLVPGPDREHDLARLVR